MHAKTIETFLRKAAEVKAPRTPRAKYSTAEKLLRLLFAEPEGISRSEFHAHFVSAAERKSVPAVLVQLREQGLVDCRSERRGKRGRTTEVWFAVAGGGGRG